MTTGKHQKSKAVASQNGDYDAEGTPIVVPETTYQLPPEGMHEARLVWVIDCGTHRSNFNDGKKQRKVIFTWELPNEKAVFVEERGKEPFLVSNIYTMSLGERSNLYRDIAAWQGKRAIETVRHNLALLLGEACLLNVLHKATKKNQLRASVISVAPLPRATRVPVQITPSLKYSITDGVAGGVYDKLPAWIQKMILKSEEIDGEHPSENEMIARNVREATANATESRPHRPVSLNEPTSEGQVVQSKSSPEDLDEDALNALNAELAGAAGEGEEYAD
jgi:hypothetical protein